MENDLIDLSYETLRKQGTGSLDYDNRKVVEVPFDRYIIKVCLSAKNEFVGIEEVSINKDFLSYKQRLAAMSSMGYHDVEQYYQDDATE